MNLAKESRTICRKLKLSSSLKRKGSDSMTAITSGEFLNEFTLYADRTHEDSETFLIQRENGKHLVLMSMDAYNALQKQLYLAKQK